MAKLAKMKVWNVELGLAVHIKAPNGKYIVIDLGSKYGMSPIHFLRDEEIGYMVLTHPHLDHFTDVQNMGSIRPKVLWRVKDYSRDDLLNGLPNDNPKYKIIEAYCNFVDSYNAPLEAINDPRTEKPFDGLTVEVFHTGALGKDNINNFSAVVVLQLANAKVVICGDNTVDSLDILMKMESFKNRVKDSCVLVAPHHGRETGYNDEFVRLVNPLLTIISDTSNEETTAIKKYENHTNGYSVTNLHTGSKMIRKCLSTRNDGNIEVVFGDAESHYKGTLIVKSQID